MQLEARTILIQEEYLKPDNSEGSDENCEEYGELEIDLDYNDNDQPLDLSKKNKCKYHTVEQAKLPTLDIKPVFDLSMFNIIKNSKANTHQTDKTDKFLTELELSKLLDPYVKSAHKKFSCTVCDI